MSKDWGDVANDRRAAVLKPIDGAGSLIIALVVEAMPPVQGERWRGIQMLFRVLRIFLLTPTLTLYLNLRELGPGFHNQAVRQGSDSPTQGHSVRRQHADKEPKEKEMSHMHVRANRSLLKPHAAITKMQIKKCKEISFVFC